jgi:hypothetical protein
LAGAGAIRSSAANMLKFLAANIGLADTRLKAAMERMHAVRNERGKVTGIVLQQGGTDIPGPQVK